MYSLNFDKCIHLSNSHAHQDVRVPIFPARYNYSLAFYHSGWSWLFYIIIHIQSCCRYCFMYSCFYIPPIPKTYSHCAMHSLHAVMLFKEYSVVEFMTTICLVSVWIFSMIFFLILGLNLVQSLFCLKSLFTELWEKND